MAAIINQIIRIKLFIHAMKCCVIFESWILYYFSLDLNGLWGLLERKFKFSKEAIAFLEYRNSALINFFNEKNLCIWEFCFILDLEYLKNYLHLIKLV